MCEVCHGHPNCPVCSPEPRMIECAACQGQGYVWYRYDLEENRETEVTEKEFNALPADETEAIEKGVPVLLHDGSSMMMKPEAMTQSQQTQVFFNGAIRDLESQRAWMESQKNYRLPRNPLASGGYKVEGSLLVVRAAIFGHFCHFARPIVSQAGISIC